MARIDATASTAPAVSDAQICAQPRLLGDGSQVTPHPRISSVIPLPPFSSWTFQNLLHFPTTVFSNPSHPHMGFKCRHGPCSCRGCPISPNPFHKHGPYQGSIALSLHCHCPKSLPETPCSIPEADEHPHNLLHSCFPLGQLNTTSLAFL